MDNKQTKENAQETVTMSSKQITSIDTYLRVISIVALLSLAALSYMTYQLERVNDNIGDIKKDVSEIQTSNAVALTKIESNDLRDREHREDDARQFKEIAQQFKDINRNGYDYKVDRR